MSISNSGSDERGKYSGGVAGDQTGKEWVVRSWYNRPWNCVLRHPVAAVREKLAVMGEAAAGNNLIGYDQGQRDTYWTALKAANYDPAKVSTACEADCSKGIIDHTRAIGYLMGMVELQKISATYTGNMRSAYKAAGFTVLTDSKYLTSDAYLLRGDILLNDAHHAATNLTNGSKAVTTGWQKDAQGWWYRKADGTYPKEEWYYIFDSTAPDGTWYYFNENGYALINTAATIDGKNYSFDQNGHATIKEEEDMYKDVNENAWYAEAVKYVAENGIMQGVGDEKFEPDRPVTRAELAQALANLHKKSAE